MWIQHNTSWIQVEYNMHATGEQHEHNNSTRPTQFEYKTNATRIQQQNAWLQQDCKQERNMNTTWKQHEYNIDT